MSRKRRNAMFVNEGQIYEYPGSMREFQIAITQSQWEQAVADTVDMFHYMTALKDTGVPALNEQWSRKEELAFRQVRRAVAEMKAIEPLLVAKHYKEDIINAMREKMKSGAIITNKMIDEVVNNTIADLTAQDSSYNTSQITGL